MKGRLGFSLTLPIVLAITAVAGSMRAPVQHTFAAASTPPPPPATVPTPIGPPPLPPTPAPTTIPTPAPTLVPPSPSATPTAPGANVPVPPPPTATSSPVPTPKGGPKPTLTPMPTATAAPITPPTTAATAPRPCCPPAPHHGPPTLTPVPMEPGAGGSSLYADGRVVRLRQTASAGSAGASEPPTQATVARGGLRITISVPKHSYPRDALVRATATIRNISPHAITIASGLQAPELIVLNKQGQDAFDAHEPLGDETLLEQKGPGPRTFALKPGKAWIEKDYVVLRGGTLTVVLIAGTATAPTVVHQIIGPTLHLHLFHELAAGIALSTTPLRATLSSAPAGARSLKVFNQAQCGDQSMSLGWSAVYGNVIDAPVDAGCDPLAWHALAGWVGHPAVLIIYPAQTSYRDEGAGTTRAMSPSVTLLPTTSARTTR